MHSHKIFSLDQHLQCTYEKLYPYLHSVLRSQSLLEPVLFGRSWSWCEDVKAKTFFYNFLAYYYMERSRSQQKKSTWSRSQTKEDRLLNTVCIRTQFGFIKCAVFVCGFTIKLCKGATLLSILSSVCTAYLFGIVNGVLITHNF